MIGRIAVAEVSPVVSCGQWPAKAVAGESVEVSALVFREGHDSVGATAVLRDPAGREVQRARMRLVAPGTDRWAAPVTIPGTGMHTFTVEGWSDAYGTWAHGVEVKVEAGVEVSVELEEGARLLKTAAAGVPTGQRSAVTAAISALRDTTLEVAERLAPALALEDLIDAYPVRELLTASESYRLDADRPRALFGSWYELFPRSEGADVTVSPPVSGTLRTAAERLPAVAAMGFDVVYLPPVHPIGRVNRKGPNNTLTPGPDDPGSPWAIGSTEGGHDALHPDLGSMKDFDAFVARTRELGMEVALDLALQCAPDHPWAMAHPEWFTERADGTIAYAENPPKKYQDIYPVNFDRDPEGIYAEVLRVVRHWTGHGVRIFRVDNPHTKPLQFWERLIAEVRSSEPDILFLAEAFTRPAMMHMLGRIGFTQSYTYFTWRTGGEELTEYLTELSTSPVADFMRPNFFVNTPDILHASLQYGGPAMFKVRALLAATLSPTYGVYAGYELFEHQAVRAGSEEYLDSEKYQLRPRDWTTEDSLAPYLTLLNRFRREHPALQWLRNITFHPTNNPLVLAYSKQTGDDTVLVAVNLDTTSVHEATISLDMPALGLAYTDTVTVQDAFTGQEFPWGEYPYVRLDPFVEPAHLLTVRRGATL